MIKKFKFLLLELPLALLCGGANDVKPTISPQRYILSENPDTVDNEDPIIIDEDPITVNEEEKACHVVIEAAKHGKIETDITEGDIGDIVTVTVKHDLLYKVERVTANGTNLVESPTTSGVYTFALVEGENKVTASFIVDEELCGELTTIVKEATEKDWTNLFTIENVITIIKWLLDGGILIAVIRYFVKDKALAKKLEEQVKKTTENIVPEATEKAVLENTKALIEPMFNQVVQDSVAVKQLMSIMVKCMVLMQQNTPEAKIAILDEFEKIKGVVDPTSVESVKKYIDELVSSHTKAYEETLAQLNNISEQHKKEIEKEKEDIVSKDNGTQI